MSTSSVDGLRALCSSLVAIVTVVVGLRLYTRSIQHIGLGIDDWMIVPAYITFIGMTACALLGIHLKQFGYSASEAATVKLSFMTEATLVISLDMLSAATLGLARISALLFFRRVFCVAGRTRALRMVIDSSAVIISLWTVAFVILPPLQCGSNLIRMWNASELVRAAHCTLGNKIILGFATSDLILETLVITMPIIPVWRLQTSFKRRLAVLCVFLTAFVSFGAVVARLVIVVNILHDAVEDETKANTSQTFMWILEAGFSLIAVNLPSLWWLKNHASPERILASMRSAISLLTVRSTESSSGSRDGYVEQTDHYDQTKATETYRLDRVGTSSEEQLTV